MLSWVGSYMRVDEPSAGAAAAPTQAQINTLMDEKDICWWSRQEKEKYQQLRPRTFSLTSMYNPQLLQNTGMDAEFDLIF